VKSTNIPRARALFLGLAALVATGTACARATSAGGADGAAGAAPVSAAAAAEPGAPADGGELPLKFEGGETGPDITVHDLMTRLYIVADDSMLGRQAAGPGGVKIAEYLAREAQRIGLEPAGENGTYFQTVPVMERRLDSATTSLAVDGGAAPLTLGRDYMPLPRNMRPAFPFGGTLRGTALPVVYGGRFGEESLKPEQAKGKLVVFDAAQGPAGQPIFQFWARGDVRRYRDAAGIAVVGLEQTPQPLIDFFRAPQTWLALTGSEYPRGATAMLVTRDAAERLLGAPLAGLKPGAAGRGTVSASAEFADRPAPYPARNVVAILRGSDERLRGQYVAIGAHSDHVGTTDEPVDHDSLRAFLTVARPRGADDELRRPNAGEQARIGAILDSLRRVHAPRVDSVFNGADDDGSGTVTVLEVAQALAKQPPKRSVLFVWHVAEEAGLWGSDYFTRHPTVPRDSIVAQINIDMVGRGGKDDLPNAGPGYLQVIGPRRLSSEYARLVEQVNTAGRHGMRFDYQYDANGHPDQYYCRSDHYMYARYGIPVAFFSAGGHRDYHQLTDEPQYIRYNNMRNTALYVLDLLRTVADLDHRLVVDRPKPDPEGNCVQ